VCRIFHAGNDTRLRPPSVPDARLPCCVVTKAGRHSGRIMAKREVLLQWAFRRSKLSTHNAHTHAFARGCRIILVVGHGLDWLTVTTSSLSVDSSSFSKCSPECYLDLASNVGFGPCFLSCLSCHLLQTRSAPTVVLIRRHNCANRGLLLTSRIEFQHDGRPT